MGKWDREKSKARNTNTTDARDEDLGNVEFKISSSSASYGKEEVPNLPALQVQQRPADFWRALNQSRLENERLAHENERQAKEIEQLRAALMQR